MGDNTTKVIRDITNTSNQVTKRKGKRDICKAIQDMIDEEFAEGFAIGELNTAKKMSLKMYKNGDSIEKIAETAEVSLDQVKEWLNSVG